jgi:transposase
LYFPALSAVRHNPAIRALYQRLRAAGKPKMVAVVAAMRKLLHQIYGVLRSRQAFDPAHVSARPARRAAAA